MRKLLTGAALGAVVLMLAACGSSNGSSSAEKQAEREADMYAISQIEKTFHESISKKDIDQMMSLWAPNATFTYGPGETAAGKQQIEDFWLTSKCVPARDRLGLRPPRLEDARHGQRRPGNAPLRVPLHRRQDGQGGGDHRSRPGRREDERPVARSPTWWEARPS